jgi:streptogramin lyase
LIRSLAIRSLLLALCAAAVLAAPAAAAPAVSGDFNLPGLGSNNKIVQGPDGNMWVTLDGNARDVARITPAGEVKEFNLGAVTPLGIAVGPEGLLWIARNGGVTSFSAADPEGTKDPTNIALIGTSPSIATGSDGNLWVVGEGKETVVRVPPGNPAGATAFPVPGLTAPKDIDAAATAIVISGLEHIYGIDAATGAVGGDFKIGGQSQGIAGNPNGQVAFSQPGNEPREFGLLAATASPIVTLIPGKDPFGVALGADGAYWAPEFTTDGLLRMSATGAVTGITGFAKGSAPRQIAAGPGNTLWVTLEMTKKIGRVSGVDPEPPSPPPTPEPKTKIEKGPKGQVPTTKKWAKVSFRFSSPDAGATFQCRVKRLAKKPPKKAAMSAGKKKKAAKPVAFKACKSPKKLSLKPGRYRFEVRAVLNGVVDATPAKRSFRVVRVFPID